MRLRLLSATNAAAKWESRLMDYNIKEIDEQYRKAEEIITVEDIERLMKLYISAKHRCRWHWALGK